MNMVQKRHRVLWAKAHLKWTVSKWKSVLGSDESKFDILVGNHGRRVLWAKEEGDLPACHQCSVQKPASLMVWGCISAYGMGSLQVLEGTMNAERYIYRGFRATYAPLHDVYFREGLVYFSRTMQNYILVLGDMVIFHIVISPACEIADTRYYRAWVGGGKRETLCTCHKLFHNYLLILNHVCVRERESLEVPTTEII